MQSSILITVICFYKSKESDRKKGDRNRRKSGRSWRLHFENGLYWDSHRIRIEIFQAEYDEMKCSKKGHEMKWNEIKYIRYVGLVLDSKGNRRFVL